MPRYRYRGIIIFWLRHFLNEGTLLYLELSEFRSVFATISALYQGYCVVHRGSMFMFPKSSLGWTRYGLPGVRIAINEWMHLYSTISGMCHAERCAYFLRTCRCRKQRERRSRSTQSPCGTPPARRTPRFLASTSCRV